MQEQSLKDKTIKGVAWNTVNTVVNLGVNFVVGIILARMLLPQDFGAVAMVGVFTSILSIFTDGGLTSALVRKENRTEADKATVFYYNLVACYVVYLIIFLIAPWIAKFYNMPILCKLARVSSLGLLISPFSGIQHMHLTANIDFRRIAFVGIIGNSFSAVIAVLMAFNGFGVWSLAVPSLLSNVLTTILLICIVRWIPKTGFSWSSFKELFGYSSKLMASWVLDKVYSNITPLIVGKFFSPRQLGLYEKAQQWPRLPSVTFTSVLQSVTFPVLSKIQDDIPSLAKNYRKILRLSAFLVFPMMVGLASVARPLTIVLITDKWLDSVILMQLICFSMMWYPIHAINLNLLTVTGRSDYFLKLEVIKKGIGLLVMAVSLPFGLVAFCAAGILSSFISLIINTYYTGKIINIGFIKQMQDLLPIFLNSLVMGVLCYFMQYLFANDVIKILAAILVGVGYYVLSSKYISKEEFVEIINIIRRKR